MRRRTFLIALAAMTAAPSVTADAQSVSESSTTSSTAGTTVTTVASTTASTTATTATTASTTSTTAPEVRRQKEIEERIRQLQGEIGEASAEESGLLGQLSQTQSRLDEFDAAIARIDGELAAATSRLNAAEADVQRLDGRYLALTGQLRDTTRSIDQVKGDVADITAEMYRRAGGGRTAAITSLALDAKTPQDLFAGEWYLSAAAAGDQEQIDNLTALRGRVEHVRTGLEDQRDEARAARDVVAQERARIAGLRSDQDRARRDVAAAVSDQERLLAQVHAQKDKFSSEIAALKAESNSIAALLRDRQSGQTLESSGSGVLGRPIGGPLTSAFGMRVHPILGTSRMHNGVDFGAATGTPVMAAGDGEVVWAGSRGGYGNAVIIDHGNTLATLYAHLSSVSVGVGQMVTRAAVVGGVGSTGLSTGPHLHFEVRQSGTPVDPSAYL